MVAAISVVIICVSFGTTPSTFDEVMRSEELDSYKDHLIAMNITIDVDNSDFPQSKAFFGYLNAIYGIESSMSWLLLSMGLEKTVTTLLYYWRKMKIGVSGLGLVVILME